MLTTDPAFVRPKIRVYQFGLFLPSKLPNSTNIQSSLIKTSLPQVGLSIAPTSATEEAISEVCSCCHKDRSGSGLAVLLLLQDIERLRDLARKSWN
ncbi:hypothetical protein G7B40_000940 [Aetokthonos hydrillicola Thurmond2011]|jgi:hypothetical protein|uniref:Uncharacterized protein n=1 Tax=Aetokthonos hydrillicola Thurmond2011 TaxID=2712845 RepID=A0AAP5M2W2_9CYAN|nr:hypothetical protein [Aetokthonos hydrillicola]MBO3463166.1 hypothetical protein [Aetokthonos hydrillicola CCALA 1050]MBW4588165.1 hypothetical protein [Aetokthonos hydrillicola CCALA 1050]MDR9893151.1 hypothetical protein [Aetokthonos hydrillicola Thurmond2011]